MFRRETTTELERWESMKYELMTCGHQLLGSSASGSEASDLRARAACVPPAPVRARRPQPVPYHWTRVPLQGSFGHGRRVREGRTHARSISVGDHGSHAGRDPDRDRSADADGLRLSRGQAGRGSHGFDSNGGQITPFGYWSVLEKRPFYARRNTTMRRCLSCSASTPTELRCTAEEPGFPASHGCIRLPMKFAEKLYGLTKVGTKVVIEG